MDRRRFVSALGLAFAGSMGGCLSRVHGGGSGRGTEPRRVRVWFEAVSLSASERESVTPIVFADLSTEEREIVRTALEDGEYTVDQDSTSPALEDLRDRVERRTGNGETLEAYLRRAETYYRVGFADGDHVVAHPDQ